MLNYLRTGILQRPQNVSKQILEHDANYYCIGLPSSFEENCVLFYFVPTEKDRKTKGSSHQLVSSSQNPSIIKIAEYINKELGLLNFISLTNNDNYGRFGDNAKIGVPRLISAMKEVGFDKFQVFFPSSWTELERATLIMFWSS